MGEAKAFPVLFPNTQNTIDEPRQRKLGKSTYFNARLMSADLRFARNTQYIFYAQYATELERTMSGVSISMRKGTRSFRGKKITAEMLNDKQLMYEMMKADKGF